MVTFEAFPKIGRYQRSICITEKLDGTNAQVIVTEDGEVAAASRTRLITPGKLTDNYGFAGWVEDHKDELRELGPGRHFGEWYGQGIQRNYGLTEKRFALFNADRWQSARPACCRVVPVLYRGPMTDQAVSDAMFELSEYGSFASAGFMKPEGIIVYHSGSRTMFKRTFEHDETGKEAA